MPTHKKNSTKSLSTIEEFKRLFRAARREHSKNGRWASFGTPAHLELHEFIRFKRIPGAQPLVTALPTVWNENNPEKALAELVAESLELPGELHGHRLYIRGLLLLRLMRRDEAISCLKSALNAPGFDLRGNVNNSLGFAYDAKGDHDTAVKFYQKALKSPGYETKGDAYNNLGTAYHRQGAYRRAVDAYQKALNESGYDTPHLTLNNRADALRELGCLDEAMQSVQKVLKEPDKEGQHERARSLKRLIEEARAGMQPSAAEEALARANDPKAVDTPEKVMLSKLGMQEFGRKDKYDEYLVREVPTRQDAFVCLRGWGSAVTLLEGGEDCDWVGGGYFLRWRGKGIVIDPGFDFMDNFHDAKLHLKEVDAVLVSHNHSDHNYDLSSLDDLRYELHRRWKLLHSEQKKKHDVSRCLFVLDEDTSRGFRDNNADHRGLPMKFSEADAQRKRWIERQNELPVTIEHFKVEHGADVPHAMGMRLRLHGEKQDFVFGYTGDTRWHPALENELAGCDLLLAHISMPSDEELLDDADYESRLGKDQGGFKSLPADGFKALHLGYRGMIELISRTKPKMVVVGEFWAGLADLRIDLVKGLRAQVKKRTGMDIPILPTGLGFRLRLPSLEVECTSCNKAVSHAELMIAPAANPFGPLSYLCQRCLG
jgi:ribonuclease BN (tRNA processing enzyme)/Tfp pilus assembly protein PilF